MNRLGDRMLSALLPTAKACVSEQAGYTGGAGSQYFQYYQCGAYCQIWQGGVGGRLTNN